MSEVVDSDLKVYDIDEDRRELSIDLPKKLPKHQLPWAPLFNSADFLADKPVMELEHYALKDRKIRMLGHRATLLRERILDAAKDQALRENKCIDAGANEVRIHGQKVRARGSEE